LNENDNHQDRINTAFHRYGGGENVNVPVSLLGISDFQMASANRGELYVDSPTSVATES